MASAGGNLSPLGPPLGLGLSSTTYILGGMAAVALFFVGLAQRHAATAASSKDDTSSKESDGAPGLLRSLLLFGYSCFLKPHAGGANDSQQSHLESFYAGQADIYDSTRKSLLHGREDMLALVAAQLRFKAGTTEAEGRKRVWVDVGGGTGWNVEAMAAFVDVPVFFHAVYLVDFSPSLCAVARRRFERLGWTNVHVVCQDARTFRLEDYEDGLSGRKGPGPFPGLGGAARKRAEDGGADLITMSYSLSMMPDYFSIVDSLGSLLSPDGIIGVCDFYAQGKVDYAFRNYTGGILGRHVPYLSRTFWRAWFDLDRVSLEPGRRDYLEYRFGTVLSTNDRNRSLGYIPYYIWVGRRKESASASSLPHEMVERNTAARLPLPSSSYENHSWRAYYDDGLAKHTQFRDEYIYAFTWEDSAVDAEILRLGPDDVVLAITSAGDNILAYAARSPARIHAVDLNPAQNHLLELKVAAYAAGLPYDDFFRLFGDGAHPAFRSLLLTRLSPHLSSRALQYWLARSHIFTDRRGRGLYDTGGSKHAIRAFRWISLAFGVRGAVRDILGAETLAEQRAVWAARLRPALLSRLVNSLVVSTEAFCWSALGVPRNQLAMIEADHAARVGGGSGGGRRARAAAVRQYMADTLDPVISSTLVSKSNPYYRVALAGSFSRTCHPEYLSPEVHARLTATATGSSSSATSPFDGLRIHTDHIDQVLSRLEPGSLTVAVVMDSMDWFSPGSDGGDDDEAGRQVALLNRALAMGGRVLLRSAGLRPWYLKAFEARGFTAKRVGERVAGRCIDRVNMYASCWVCVKTGNLPPVTPVSTPGAPGSPAGSVDGEEGWLLEA